MSFGFVADFLSIFCPRGRRRLGYLLLTSRGVYTVNCAPVCVNREDEKAYEYNQERNMHLLLGGCFKAWK